MTLFRGVLGKIVNSSVYALAVIDLVTSIVINLSSAPLFHYSSVCYYFLLLAHRISDST